MFFISSLTNFLNTDLLNTFNLRSASQNLRPQVPQRYTLGGEIDLGTVISTFPDNRLGTRPGLSGSNELSVH
jgi:hypothetical protein